LPRLSYGVIAIIARSALDAYADIPNLGDQRTIGSTSPPRTLWRIAQMIGRAIGDAIPFVLRGSPTLVGDASFFLPVVSSNEYRIGTESDRLIPYGGLEIKW
jgi:hypothetical protein